MLSVTLKEVPMDASVRKESAVEAGSWYPQIRPDGGFEICVCYFDDAVGRYCTTSVSSGEYRQLWSDKRLKFQREEGVERPSYNPTPEELMGIEEKVLREREEKRLSKIVQEPVYLRSVPETSIGQSQPMKPEALDKVTPHVEVSPRVPVKAKPTAVSEMVAKYKQAAQTIRQRGQLPTVEALAKELGLSPVTVKLFCAFHPNFEEASVTSNTKTSMIQKGSAKLFRKAASGSTTGQRKALFERASQELWAGRHTPEPLSAAALIKRVHSYLPQGTVKVNSLTTSYYALFNASQRKVLQGRKLLKPGG
jgi:hypothetical protein